MRARVPAHPRSARRRASVYVLVLVAVVACSAMIVGALDLVRAVHTEAASINDYFQASANADAGLGLALREINSTQDWRWSRGDGAWFSDVALPGGGTFSVEVTGGSGTLSTNARDPVLIIATGIQGSARAITQVELGLIPGGGPAITGTSLGAYTPLAWWPLDGSDSAWCNESILGATGGNEQYGAGKTYPGAIPAHGITTAPWFWGSSSAKLNTSSAIDSVRTIAFWFLADSTASLQYILEREDRRNSAGEWAFYLSGGDLSAEYVGPTGTIAFAGAPVSAGQWHHVVLVADTTRLVLYLDGSVADSDAAPGSNYWVGSGLAPVRASGLVSSLSAYLGPFTGSISDVLLLQDAMTAADVASLYAAYPPPGEYRPLVDSLTRRVR